MIIALMSLANSDIFGSFGQFCPLIFLLLMACFPDFCMYGNF